MKEPKSQPAWDQERRDISVQLIAAIFTRQGEISHDEIDVCIKSASEIIKRLDETRDENDRYTY